MAFSPDAYKVITDMALRRFKGLSHYGKSLEIINFFSQIINTFYTPEFS